jgi:hypothetical protein
MSTTISSWLLIMSVFHNATFLRVTSVDGDLCCSNGFFRFATCGMHRDPQWHCFSIWL